MVFGNTCRAQFASKRTKMTAKFHKKGGVSKDGGAEASSRLQKPLSGKKKPLSIKKKPFSIKKKPFSIKKKPVSSKKETLSGKSKTPAVENTLESVEVEPNGDDSDEVVDEKKKTVKRMGSSSESGSDRKKQRVEAKERKESRKNLNDNYAIMVKAKKLWESVRRGDCPKLTQQKLCVQLHTLVKGKVRRLLLTHDTSRVIECLVLVGSPEIKDALFNEVKGRIVSIMRAHYSKFFVMKMLKFGTKEQRMEIMNAMQGKIIDLIRHRIAGSVVELAFNEYANGKQRTNMVQEFYGVKYTIFKSDEPRTLETILNEEPAQKDVILKSMKNALAPILEKSIVSHSIIHRVIIEFLTYCNEKDRTEMIESVRDFVVEMLHTKDGARVGMQCVWHGTNKDRKLIIKSMKTHVAKICKEENGHMVLLALFESVDDTILIQKALIGEMMKSAAELVFDPYGRKVLLHLLTQRNPTYIHPHVIKVLAMGDGNATSKKDKELRIKELLLAVSPHMLKVVADNAEKMLNCSSAVVVLRAILTHAIGDKSKAFEKIGEVIAKPFIPNVGKFHIIEDAAVHLILKNLIKLDKQMFENNNEDYVFFSEILLEKVTNSDLLEWIRSNRGTYTILLMLETGLPNVVQRLYRAIRPVKGRLEKKTFKGAELLLDKLDAYNTLEKS